MKREIVVSGMCVTVVLCCSALGSLVEWTFPMDGTQAGTGSPGSGVGIINLNTDTRQLEWNITFGGLVGDELVSHFHGPAPAGQPAGVQISLPPGTPKIDSQVISEQQQTDLLAGLWYVNIHTDAFPGGEIRGQVVPEPVTISIMGLGALILLRRSRR